MRSVIFAAVSLVGFLVSCPLLADELPDTGKREGIQPIRLVQFDLLNRITPFHFCRVYLDRLKVVDLNIFVSQDF